MLAPMSNYGQEPPYGQNPNPYGQQPPYGQQQPYGQQPQPYGQQPPPYGPQPGQWTPQPPIARKPTLVSRPLPVVTMEQVPAREIDEVLGEVIGVVART